MTHIGNSRMTITLRLTGWKAVVAVAILIAGFFLAANRSYRQAQEHRAVAEENLRLWLASQGASEYLSDGASQTREQFAAQAQKLAEAIAVKIETVEMRGLWIGRFVFRVEYRIPRKTQPDEKEVRYFAMDYSPLPGWDVIPDRSSEFAWKMAPLR